MTVRPTRRNLLLGMVTAAAGAFPLVATAQPRKRGAADDPVAEQIIRELGRIHRDERQRGTRLEHMRGTAGQLRLLALVMATNGTDELIKEAARTKAAARPESLSVEMVRQEMTAVGFETEGDPLFLPTLTQDQLNAGRRTLQQEGLSPTIARVSNAIDLLAADASLRSVYNTPGREGALRPVVMMQRTSYDCELMKKTATTTWVMVANICLLDGAVCPAATVSATAYQVYVWFSCGY